MPGSCHYAFRPVRKILSSDPHCPRELSAGAVYFVAGNCSSTRSALRINKIHCRQSGPKSGECTQNPCTFVHNYSLFFQPFLPRPCRILEICLVKYEKHDVTIGAENAGDLVPIFVQKYTEGLACP